MKKIEFTKMHGIGNDYIYIDCFKQDIDDPARLARIMSPRRTSVGSDGVILICPSGVARKKVPAASAAQASSCRPVRLSA